MSETTWLPLPNKRDDRTRLERLLNYKRYVDWLVDRELQRLIDKTKDKQNEPRS